MTTFQEIIESRRPTWQEYIDEVKRRCREYLFPASSDGVCYYRKGDAQCIAGILMPDSKYVPIFENQSCSEPDIWAIINGPESLTKIMMAILQALHDEYRINELFETLDAFSKDTLPSSLKFTSAQKVYHTLGEVNRSGFDTAIASYKQVVLRSKV